MNLFSNSVLIDDKIRNSLNNEIATHFKELNIFIDKLGIETNIYYTGSLARKEPSIRLKHGRYQLESDFDFFFIVQNEEDKNKYYDISITKLLNQKFPNYKSSVVLLRNDEVSNIKSRIGANLYQAMNYPVRLDFDPVKLNKPVLTKDDYLESLINIMAILITLPEKTEKNQLFKSDKNYFVSKLLSESLKLLSKTESTNEFLNRYSEYSNFLSFHDLLEIIKARELNNKLNEDFDYLQFLSNVINFAYDSTSIVEIISNKMKLEKNFINDCQCLFLNRFFSVSDSSEEMNRQFEAIKKRLSVKDASKDNLIKIRIEYMLALHYRNTESTGNTLPDLKEDNI